jgi:hypothetical protein
MSFTRSLENRTTRRWKYRVTLSKEIREDYENALMRSLERPRPRKKSQGAVRHGSRVLLLVESNEILRRV